MPSALFCWHSYGEWGKLHHGVKTRRCKKCRKPEARNAGFFDQLFCWHHWHKCRKNKTLHCLTCDKQKGKQ